MIPGKNVRLRAAERSDLPTFVRWINDPEVIAGLSIYHPFSMAEEEKWFENMLSRPADERPLVIEAKEKNESWASIGTLSLFDISWRARNAEFGIMIGEKSYWNRGLGSEALSLLLEHGFQTLNLNRIHLRVFATNQRAIHTYEKLGFVHEGRGRQEEFRDGEYLDVLRMSILVSEWKQQREGR